MERTDETAPVSDNLPRSGRILGVDYGTVRIGLAICDPGQSVASPLETRQVQSRDQDAVWFAEKAKTESAVGFVVGLPVHMSGDASENPARRSRLAYGCAK